MVAIIAAAAALSGALGSQLVATRAGLRTRRLELYFKAKADAYRTLLERIGEFALEPTSLPRYLAFLAAYEGAFLFASEKVAESLRGRSGLRQCSATPQCLLRRRAGESRGHHVVRSPEAGRDANARRLEAIVRWSSVASRPIGPHDYVERGASMWQRRTFHECASELGVISEDFRAAHTYRFRWPTAQRERVMVDTSQRGVEILRVLALSIRADQDFRLTDRDATAVGVLRP